MLDANLLRNDLDAVAARLSERGYTLDRGQYQALDQRRRSVLQEAEALKAERNRVSEEVGRLKRAKENADHLIAQQREVGDKLKELEAAERELEAATEDKGGHRAEALRLVRSAQKQVRQGIKFDRKH